MYETSPLSSLIEGFHWSDNSPNICLPRGYRPINMMKFMHSSGYRKLPNKSRKMKGHQIIKV